MSDIRRFVEIMHRAFGEFLGGATVVTAAGEVVEDPAGLPVVSAGDVSGMKRDQLDNLAVKYRIPLVDDGGARINSPKEIRISPLKKQIAEFMTQRNMEMSANHAKKVTEAAPTELPDNVAAEPVSVAPPPATVQQELPVAPPAAVPVAAVPPAAAPTQKVATPPPPAVAPVAPPVVAPPSVAPVAAPATEPTVDADALRKALVAAAAAASPAEQHKVLWNFWTQHQSKLSQELEGFFSGLSKAPPEVQAKVKAFFDLQGCTGNCTTCPHGPSQGSVCHAIFDDTVKVAGYEDLTTAGVAVKMVSPPAGQWSNNANGQAVLAY